MIRRDWYKRHVDILAQAIGAALGLKKKGDVQASIAAIEEAVRKTFGTHGKLALMLPLDQFLSLACRGEKPSAELLAELERMFLEWAALLEAAGDPVQAQAARSRARDVAVLAGGAERP
ncbi:MAG: hypothetical protein HY553_03140 [Elusimicrobia bacterium]|nr:hypothetical protein [Elusimicrobiota bacterium]